MYSIYILLTRTRTILSRTIHAAPGNDYTHAALSLDESFTRLYSFGRKYRYSYLPAGFVRESVEKGLQGSSQDAPCAVYKLEISDRKYKKLCSVLETMEAEKEVYQYNILGLFLCLLGKTPSLMRPADLQGIPQAHQVFCGSVGQLRMNLVGASAF